MASRSQQPQLDQKKIDEYIEKCVSLLYMMSRHTDTDLVLCVMVFDVPLSEFSSRIHYSDRYSDDQYEYRHVILPKPLFKIIPKEYFSDDDSGTLRLLSEAEWRGIGITQSLGWVHYEVHGTSLRRALIHVVVERVAHAGTGWWAVACSAGTTCSALQTGEELRRTACSATAAGSLRATTTAVRKWEGSDEECAKEVVSNLRCIRAR